ncbi:hypothetical protein HK100_010490, partial [Physocladia obscura]
IYNTPFALSHDKIEEQFAVNYVGHFHFTISILPLLRKSLEPRIVNVTSSLHALASAPGGILFKTINDPTAMTGVQRYAQSKLANILFTRALHKRFGDTIFINSADLGYVATNIAKRQQDGTLKILDAISGPLFAKSASDGALTQIYAAAGSDVVEKGYRGVYFAPLASKETGDKALSALAKRLRSF